MVNCALRVSVNQATVELPTAGSGVVVLPTAGFGVMELKVDCMSCGVVDNPVGGSVRSPVCGVDDRVVEIGLGVLAVGSGVVLVSAQKLPPQT